MKPLNTIAALLADAVLFGVVSVFVVQVIGNVPEWGRIQDGEPLWDEPVSAPRSSCWKKTREDWLAEHPRCEFKDCGRSGEVEPHHCIPFHVNEKYECDITNLITLCRGGANHHLWVGHQGNFRESNPNIREDCRRGRYPPIGLQRMNNHDERMQRAKENRFVLAW